MNIIIGKRSNLSQKLSEKIKNCISISSDKVDNKLPNILKDVQQPINLIFNNFQNSTLLSENSMFDKYIENSIVVTAKVLAMLLSSNLDIAKIIYTSSSSVYGNNKFCSETDQVMPMSLQAALKVANEELIKRFCYSRGINFTIARIFNMYGGNDNFSVISKIKKAYREKESLSIVNDGHSIRDYIHIDDVVNVYRTLLSTDKHYPVVNVALGQGNRISEILNFLKNHHISVKTENTTRDEIKASIADVTLLSELINIDKFINVHEYLLNELSKK